MELKHEELNKTNNIKHDLTTLYLEYRPDTQEFIAVNKLDANKPFNKTQMFSIGIFIAQIERRFFMSKSVINRLNKLNK